MSAQELLDPHFVQRQPMQVANSLEHLGSEEGARILAAHEPATVAPVLERMAPVQAQALLQGFPPPFAAAVLGCLNVPRAAALLRMFAAEERAVLLDSLDATVRRELENSLRSPTGSAAAMMDPRVLHLSPDMQVQAALELLRRLNHRGRGTQARRIMLLLDDEGRIEGMVAIQDLALADPDDDLRDYMQPVPAVVPPAATREEILAVLEEHRVSSIPVVDDAQRLIGIVRLDELTAIAREDAVGDIQAMVGVGRAEQALSPPWFSVRQRMPWLQINLFTAFAAAAVVGLFEDTIAGNTALAVLLPVVAGQSGNTGAQALAVVMRGLTLREITLGHWLRVLRKEFLVSILNGFGVALTTGLTVYLWSRSFGLTSVIVLAMIAAMAIAGIAGAAVPLLLTKLRQDPAQSSSIILTTVTDVAGFFAFLGIATLMISLL